MDFKKRFSFPINFDEIFVKKSIDLSWFERHAEVINEVYLEPSFTGINMKDMNGQNYAYDSATVIKFLEEIKSYGIKVCVIFNDVFDNSTRLLEEFKQALVNCHTLVDIVVVPDKSWLVLREDYPHLQFKNTVINLPTYEQVRDGMYDDYDCIYIHDEIIHNHDLYKAIKGSRKFGTVVNYSDCSTHCKFKREHYALVRKGKYDYNSFCKTKDYGPIELLLKRNSIPTMRSEFDHYLDVIDIYKLQGRNTTGTFRTAVEIVEGIVNEQEVFSEYTKLKEVLSPISIIKWKHNIRNCGGDCDNCSYCDDILKEIK